MLDFSDNDEFSSKWGTDDFYQQDQNEEISLKGEFFPSSVQTQPTGSFAWF